MKKKSRNLSYDAKELRKMIVENPDLPLVVFVGENTYNDDFMYTSCTDVTAEIDEILDCDHPFDEEFIYGDRNNFKEHLISYYEDKHVGTVEEFDEFIKKELEEYEPFWKKAIVVYVDN